MTNVKTVTIKNNPVYQVKHLIKTGIDRADDYSKIGYHEKANRELDELEYLFETYRKMIDQRSKEDEVVLNV